MALDTTKAADTTETLSDDEAVATELKPKFQALPMCLRNSDDELQPEFTHTPRPKQA
jgi:hypothetical protein